MNLDAIRTICAMNVIPLKDRWGFPASNHSVAILGQIVLECEGDVEHTAMQIGIANGNNEIMIAYGDGPTPEHIDREFARVLWENREIWS